LNRFFAKWESENEGANEMDRYFSFEFLQTEKKTVDDMLQFVYNDKIDGVGWVQLMNMLTFILDENVEFPDLEEYCNLSLEKFLESMDNKAAETVCEFAIANSTNKKLSGCVKSLLSE